MSDVDPVAAIVLEEVAVRLNQSSQAKSVRMRTVMLRQLQAVFAVATEIVGIRDASITKDGRDALPQLDPALLFLMNSLFEVPDINITAADTAVDTSCQFLSVMETMRTPSSRLSLNSEFRQW